MFKTSVRAIILVLMTTVVVATTVAAPKAAFADRIRT